MRILSISLSLPLPLTHALFFSTYMKSLKCHKGLFSDHMSPCPLKVKPLTVYIIDGPTFRMRYLSGEQCFRLFYLYLFLLESKGQRQGHLNISGGCLRAAAVISSHWFTTQSPGSRVLSLSSTWEVLTESRSAALNRTAGGASTGSTGKAHSELQRRGCFRGGRAGVHKTHAEMGTACLAQVCLQRRPEGGG